MSQDPAKPRGLFGRLFGGASAPPSPAASTPPVEPAAVAEPDAVAEPAHVSEPVPTDTAATDSPTPAGGQGGWFQRLRTGLSRTSKSIGEGITGIFTKRKLDAATLDDLEDVLLQSDLGLATTERILSTLKATRYDKDIAPDEVRTVLAEEVARVLAPVAKPLIIDAGKRPHVVLVVGVNGSGKTTTIGKLAAQWTREGRSVLIAAGDTFRAAAVEQLKVWGERAGVPVMSRPTGSDAAGLAYDALAEAQKTGADILLVDTAGRLQNKTALMDELEKVIRVMRRLDPAAPHDVVLVLDATTGQNALNQVEVFKEKAGVTGLVMTKLDGTARGGILVAIAAKFALPVHAIGVGEGIDDLQAFDPVEFAEAVAAA